MSSLQSDVTEQVMIELLGRPGIDLLIVQGIADESAETDRMALTALEGDVVVVDWQSESSVVSRFAVLGVDGYSASHELNPQPQVGEVASGRRLYCFDLRLAFSASRVAATVLKLLAAKQIKTVSIGNLTPVTPSRLPVVAAKEQPLEPKPSVLRSVPSVPSSTMRVPETFPEQVLAEIDEDQQLDRLVDGLNDAQW